MRMANTLIVAALLAVAAAGQAAEPNVQPAPGADVLSFAELEKRASAQVPDIREMEVEGRLLKVEGYDVQGRKVKLVVDRRNGSVLSHRIKPGKQPLRRAPGH
jgi:hypothetical protein